MRRRSGFVLRACSLLTVLCLSGGLAAPAWAGGANSFRVSSQPREIVFFVGVTSFEEAQTRSVTVYGDGTALLHLDTEKETLEQVALKLEREELEATLKTALEHNLTRWDSEGLGRRAEALGARTLGAESKSRTRLLLAFESLTHDGMTERTVSRTLVLHDSRALKAAFPELDEYAAVVQIEDWMESLWQRSPLEGTARPTAESTAAVPTGSDELLLRAESGPGMALRKAKVEFFGDGGVLLEIRQPSGELLQSRRGKLGAAELAEFQKLARRLAVFDPRAIAVQMFRKSGRSTPLASSDSGPQVFEIRLKGADGADWIHRFEYTGGISASRFPSIRELEDIQRVWSLGIKASGGKF